MELSRPVASHFKAAVPKQQQKKKPNDIPLSLAVTPSLPPSRWGLLRSLRNAVAAGAMLHMFHELHSSYRPSLVCVVLVCDELLHARVP